MALNKVELKKGIKLLLADMLTRETDSTDEFAERLSNLLEVFVKSATVTVASGISVATTGSATAQTGRTTTTGSGTIT